MSLPDALLDWIIEQDFNTREEAYGHFNYINSAIEHTIEYYFQVFKDDEKFQEELFDDIEDKIEDTIQDVLNYVDVNEENIKIGLNLIFGLM